MKQEFSDIYRTLYAEYIDENVFRRRRPLAYYNDLLTMVIRESIDTADKEGTLRPDAKYFLLVNFHHLVVRPLSERRIDRDILFGEEFFKIKDDLQADIATIVSETKKDAEQGEISGHQIMRTIDRVWKNLKTTRLELWG